MGFENSMVDFSETYLIEFLKLFSDLRRVFLVGVEFLGMIFRFASVCLLIHIGYFTQ